MFSPILARVGVAGAARMAYTGGMASSRDEVDPVTGEQIAWDREESESCERGTPGCSVHHTRESECQTW